MDEQASYIPQPVSSWQRLKVKLFRFFRLHYGPSLKLYTGFGNETTCVIYGHAFSLSPFPRKTYRKFFVFNSIALLRLFMVRPMKNAKVKLLWEGHVYETITGDDGFFRFEWKPSSLLQPGTYKVQAKLMSKSSDTIVDDAAEGEIRIPSSTAFTFISDIDDTFLISHSSNLRKRLFILLTENARSRRSFDGAVRHYRLLNGSNDNQKKDNIFFYVSSSEWNLYNYIREFVRINNLPQGVFLLNQIKTFSKLFSTGKGNHEGKFTRIIRIIEAYPHQKFILLGDDSQRDIFIYTSIVEHFPQNVYCVYIRRVQTPEKPHVREKQKIIEKAGVLFFYFAHSEEAILHSQQIKLIE